MALKPETTKQEQKPERQCLPFFYLLRVLVSRAGRKIGLAQWVILFLGFIVFAAGVVMLRY